MATAELSVLVVDDDFRVAELHAGIVTALPGFTVAAVVNSLAGARTAMGESTIDLALVDVYLPDGSGIEFVREIRIDALMLTAAAESGTVRDALAAGALGYLVKPFDHLTLAARLAGYARYRRLLSAPVVSAADIAAALEALRPTESTAPPVALVSPTKELVLQAVQAALGPMSALEVAEATGISRATAHRHLSALVAAGIIRMRLRYGTTGRPEQEYTVRR